MPAPGRLRPEHCYATEASAGGAARLCLEELHLKMMTSFNFISLSCLILPSVDLVYIVPLELITDRGGGSIEKAQRVEVLATKPAETPVGKGENGQARLGFLETPLWAWHMFVR